MIKFNSKFITLIILLILAIGAFSLGVYYSNEDSSFADSDTNYYNIRLYYAKQSGAGTAYEIDDPRNYRVKTITGEWLRIDASVEISKEAWNKRYGTAEYRVGSKGDVSTLAYCSLYTANNMAYNGTVDFTLGSTVTVTTSGIKASKEYYHSKVNGTSFTYPDSVSQTEEFETRESEKNSLWVKDTQNTPMSWTTNNRTTSRYYYVVLSPIKYTYTWKLDKEGTTFETTQGDFTNYYTLPTSEPTRTGYTFDGWYNDAGKKITSTTVKNTPGNETFTAKWTEKEYTVTFDKQGGSGGDSSVTATYTKEMPKINPPTRTGYNFNGYYTEKNGSGTKYYDNNGNGVRNWDIASNTTLYAYWSANGYTLKADINKPDTETFLTKVSWSLPSGWSSSSDKSYASKTVKYDSVYGELPLPTREGYIFDGWYDASSGGNQVTTSTKMDSVNGKTIYAHWTANRYTITFNQNKGSGGTGSITVTYDSAMPGITLPSRIGYSFAGYYDSPQADFGESGGGIQYYSSTGESSRNWDKTSNTTLYARWLPRTDYKVDINILSPSGVQDGQSGTMTLTYGDKVYSGTGEYQSFNNITFKESWKISNITPTPGYILTSVRASAGTLTDNGDGSYTFTANFDKNPNGSWDATITIQMGYTWTNYAQEPEKVKKIIDGKEVDVRLISKPEHLAWVSKMLLTTTNGGYYLQTNTIDMGAHYWYPIGAEGKAFTGNYNGQGFAIINLKTSPNMVTRTGLFGQVEQAIVQNVVLLNADIQGGSDTGTVAGRSVNGVIKGCYVEGNVTGTNRGIPNAAVEGLVGYSSGGLIEKCYYSGEIRGVGSDKSYGLITYEDRNGTIKDCIAKTTGTTKFYNSSANVDSCLYLYGSNYENKKYYDGTFENWVISNGEPLPAGLTWVGTAGDKVTNISQITSLGYSKI